MKRLIAILAMLLLGPAMAQEVTPIQTGNLVTTPSMDGPTGTTPVGWELQGTNFSGGSVQPNCGSASNTGKCFIFSFQGATLSQNIDLSSYETNSFDYRFDFWYKMACNNSIGGSCENPDGPYDLFGASFVLNDTNGEFGGYNVIPISPDYFTVGDQGVNEQGYRHIVYEGNATSDFLFTSARVIFYGIDTGFWGGFYGPQLDNVGFSINYLPPPEEPIAVDCTLFPTDPTCIIQDLTDFTDEELLATTEPDTGEDGSDDGSEPIVEDDEEEETYLADETVEETDLEETLQDEETSSDEEVVVAEANEREVAYRELTDEEKAQILADSISKNTLESALSIAENAVAATTLTATTEVNVATTSRATAANETDDKNDEEKTESLEEQLSDNGTEAASDLLETGRTLNAQSLAITEAQSEQSASDSVNQAESIAENSTLIKSVETIKEDIVAGVSDTFESNSAIENITVDSATTSVDIEENTVVAVTTESTIEVIVEEKVEETAVQETVTDNNVESNTETSNESVDSFTDIMNVEIKSTDTSIEDLELVQSIIAQSEQKQEDSISETFSEEEKVTIQNDPNLANAFNVVPSTTNLELAGVLGNKEEKSDAEKRAEEVVAANAKEQEEINKNYMDADQSGIVAAMGSDTDVSSYRSAMLNDNNIWYKPEDIYKNVVYKDNVRGSYYLEKGNSDTYKKMVEEQYR